jgi:hypothetical protein
MTKKKMEHAQSFKQSDEFLRKYKIALKLNISRQQLGAIIGMKPDSIRRKNGKLGEYIGMILPHLRSDDTEITQEKLKRFEDEYKRTLAKTTGVVKTGKRYVITSAQNATPVNLGFLGSLTKYCEHNDAELLVIPYRYRNPTSVFTQNNNQDDWWNVLIADKLVDTQVQLCNNLVILGNVKTQPTAADPLSGLEAFTGTDSTILGHPKVQSKSVPTMDGKNKLVLTTGAITEANYSDSKAGWKGDFHHCLAAIVVEIDANETFHVRHVHASGPSGNFYDLDKLYTSTTVTSGHRAAALITGDTHVEFVDEVVENVTYHGDDSIVGVLKPEVMVFHDLCDFYSRNHHHRGNDIIAVGKHRFGRNNIQDELQGVADFIDRVSRPNTKNVVVKSNHDEAFDRYLREADARGDYENAQFYYYMKYNQLKHIRKTDTGFATIDPLEFWCKFPENGIGLANLDDTLFLKRDESFKVKNIELGFHGDVGANGARGDAKGFARLSNKMIVGHSHTPMIYNGCYVVGLSASKNLEYRHGPSSWMHTHCVIYPDGKRTLINIVNGAWKT